MKQNMSLRDKLAEIVIPKNSPYCHYGFKYSKKNKTYMAKACVFWCMKYNREYGCKMEYCKYLKEFLDIQDQVKDCGVNNGWDD